MIHTDDEYTTTVQYVDRLQRILLELRRTHTPTQFEGMSKAYLKELTRAQRDIARFLAAPDAPETRTP